MPRTAGDFPAVSSLFFFAQVVLEAESVSDALGIPLYRVGDTLPRCPSQGAVQSDDAEGGVGEGPKVISV